MASFEVVLKDRSVEQVADVHAYQQEGQMTTFFRNDEPRSVVDSWSRRIFSVRTSEVLLIRERTDPNGAVWADADVTVAGRVVAGRVLGPLRAVEA